MLVRVFLVFNIREARRFMFLVLYIKKKQQQLKQKTKKKRSTLDRFQILFKSQFKSQ